MDLCDLVLDIELIIIEVEKYSVFYSTLLMKITKTECNLDAWKKVP